MAQTFDALKDECDRLRSRCEILEGVILDLDRLYRAEDTVAFTSLLEMTVRDLRKTETT